MSMNKYTDAAVQKTNIVKAVVPMVKFFKLLKKDIFTLATIQKYLLIQLLHTKYQISL